MNSVDHRLSERSSRKYFYLPVIIFLSEIILYIEHEVLLVKKKKDTVLIFYCYFIFGLII